jgi:ATP-dependent helicase YprA (DUF1998 family)
MNIAVPPTVPEILSRIRALPPHELNELFEQVIPRSKAPSEYMDTLSKEDQLVAHRACLLSWFVTAGTQVPREIQLRSCLATSNGQDSLLYAGTGSGKTLPIALNILLEDLEKNYVTITISPLKRLQITQVLFHNHSLWLDTLVPSRQTTLVCNPDDPNQ